MLRHQILLTIALAPSLRASEFDWVEGENDAPRDYYNYNRAAQLQGRNFLGDSADAAGNGQGDNPFGSATADRSANDGQATLILHSTGPMNPTPQIKVPSRSTR